MQQNEKHACSINGCSASCKHGKMMMGLVAAMVVVGGYFFFMRNESVSEDAAMMKQNATSKESVVQKDSMMDNESIKKSGSYEMYDASKIALAKTGKVVLFFRASWCPSCKAIDADIRKNAGAISENVTILDVDYDKYSDLKKKYAVTTQHTFVQVDENGNELKKWIGSPTLADLESQLK